MDSKQEENQPNPEGGNEEDPTTTFDEIVRDFDEEEKKAELLFGAQDPSVCTFPEGYKPRQTVFTCLTCTPEPQMAGICYGCHLNCHEGHDIVELYTKRKFRCDCGNTKFGEAKCSLYEEKDKENGYNVYNHNYNGKFCTCDIFYPDDNRGHELLQCEICEDWFHDDHITQRHIDLGERPTNNEPVEQETESSDSLVCSACVKKLPFLTRIPAGKEPFCHSNLTEEQLKLDVEAQNVSLIISSFRKRLCKCSGCTRIYEMADCDFLLDDEDDIGAFERESKEKAAENKPLTEQEEMREIVSTMGMEGAQIFYSRVNEFKRKLGDFMNRASENGKTVTEADVKSFFGNLKEDDNERKRARFENGE